MSGLTPASAGGPPPAAQPLSARQTPLLQSLAATRDALAENRDLSLRAMHAATVKAELEDTAAQARAQEQSIAAAVKAEIDTSSSSLVAARVAEIEMMRQAAEQRAARAEQRAVAAEQRAAMPPVNIDLSKYDTPPRSTRRSHPSPCFGVEVLGNGSPTQSEPASPPPAQPDPPSAAEAVTPQGATPLSGHTVSPTVHYSPNGTLPGEATPREEDGRSAGSAPTSVQGALSAPLFQSVPAPTAATNFRAFEQLLDRVEAEAPMEEHNSGVVRPAHAAGLPHSVQVTAAAVGGPVRAGAFQRRGKAKRNGPDVAATTEIPADQGWASSVSAGEARAPASSHSAAPSEPLPQPQASTAVEVIRSCGTYLAENTPPVAVDPSTPSGPPQQLARVHVPSPGLSTPPMTAAQALDCSQAGSPLFGDDLDEQEL